MYTLVLTGTRLNVFYPGIIIKYPSFACPLPNIGLGSVPERVLILKCSSGAGFSISSSVGPGVSFKFSFRVHFSVSSVPGRILNWVQFWGWFGFKISSRAGFC